MDNPFGSPQSRPTDRPNGYLTTNPQQVEFLDRAQNNAFRKTWLGDPEAVPSAVSGSVKDAHNALEEGVSKIKALRKDSTRTEPQKHDAGRVVEAGTVARLERTKAHILEYAKDAAAVAEQRINAAFSLQESKEDTDARGGEQLRAQMHGEIRAHIRELAKQPGGFREIRELAKSHPEAAKVVAQSPAFLLGLASEKKDEIYIDMIGHFAPDEQQTLLDSIALREIAGRYDQTIRSVKASFYNREIANKMRDRVEI